MITVFFVIVFAIIAISAGMYGYHRKQSERRSRGGWYGLGVLALLFAGLWLSGTAGNESLAYGFGIALMFALPALLAASAGSAVGSALRYRENKNLPP